MASWHPFRAVLGCAIFAWSFAVGAANEAEFTRGVDWLAAQPQPTGVVAGEASSAATPFQVRTEVLVTLKQLSTAPNALADGIAQQASDGTEYTARKIISLAPLGRDVAAQVATLLASQNADGGWGADAGFASSPLDSAFALLALKAAAATQTAAIDSALQYLVAAQAANGSFGLGDQPSIYQTAYALQALNAFSQSRSLGLQIQSAKDWLVSRQGSGAYATVLDNAVAAIALVGATTDSSAYAAIQLALWAAQRADGSWPGGPAVSDPYHSALALRALAALRNTQQQPPTTGQVQGRVVDAAGAGIGGASIQATGAVSRSVTTNAAGAFIVDQLPPGTYTVQATKAGYTTVSQQASVTAGAATELGNITLVTATGDATLQGTIRDGATGQPLSAATVTVAGRPPATTDATGNYQVTGIAPGTVSVTVAKAGYQTLQATATLSAGVVLVFSPNLTPEGQAAATVIGTVKNRANGQGIVGATVKVGTASTTTGTGGTFQLPGLVPGAAQLEVSANGYTTLLFTATFVQGTNDVGAIELDALSAARVSGRVSDSDTNLPIGGATASIGALSAVTNVNGIYEIIGVTQRQFSVSVSAPGYQSKSTAVTLPSLTDAIVDVVLTKTAPASAITLRRVSTNLPVYNPFNSIEIEAELQNAAAVPADVYLRAVILDSQQVPVLEAPLVLASVPASAFSFEAELETHLTSQAPGNYSVVVRGYDAADNLILEGGTSFVINAVTQLAANIDLEPPIVLPGQPVAIRADVFNHGNLDLPAGEVELAITLDRVDTHVAPTPSTVVTPIISGAPATNLIGGVYDSAGTLYLLNGIDRKIIKYANGVTEVLPFTLPSIVNGVGVTYSGHLDVDDAGFLYALTFSNRIVKFKLSDGTHTAIATGHSYTAAMARERSTQRIYTLALDGLWRMEGDGSGRQRVVGPGFQSPRGIARASDGNLYVTNFFGDSVSRVDAAGTVTTLPAVISRPTGITVGPDGRLYVAGSTISKVLRLNGDGTIDPSYNLTGAISTPQDLRFAPNGDLFLLNGGSGTNQNLSVVRQGTTNAVPFAKSVARLPQGMAYDSDNNLWIAGNGDLTKLGPNDVATVVASGFTVPRGVAVAPGNGVYVATGIGLMTWINGVRDTLVSGPLLSDPRGVAFGPAGKPYLAEFSLDRVTVVNGRDSVTPFVESHIVSGTDVKIAANGDRYVLNQGSLSHLPAAGGGSVIARWTAGITMFGLAIDPTGGFLTHDNTSVKKIASGAITRSTPTPFLAHGIVAMAGGDALVAEDSSGAIRLVTASGTLVTTPYAQAGGGVKALAGDGNGALYVLLKTGEIKRIGPTPDKLVSSLGTFVGGIRLAYDSVAGEIYLALDRALPGVTTSAGVVAIKSGSPTRKVVETRTFASVAFGAGALQALDAGALELVTYTAQGVQSASLFGFYRPTGIAFDGNTLLISDNYRVVAVDAGAYPRVLQKRPMGGHIAVRDGYLYGTLPQEGVGAAEIDARLVRTPLGGGYTADNRPLEVVYTVAASDALTGVAIREGAVAVASPAESRVEVVTPTVPASLVAGYVGITNAVALAVDPAGRPLISGSASTQKIIRFDTSGLRSTVFSTANAGSLVFDAAGNLYAGEVGGEIFRYAPDGTKTSVGFTTSQDSLLTAVYFQGIAVSPSGEVFATESSSTGQMVRKKAPVGTLMNVFATGISPSSDATILRETPDGGFLAGSTTMGTLVKWNGSGLAQVASGFPNMKDAVVTASGRIYVSGSSAELTAIGTDGLRVSLPTFIEQGSSGNAHGLAAGSGESLAAFAFGKAVKDTFTFTSNVPQPGALPSLVRPIAKVVPGPDGVRVDFGAWTPPYAGDYSFRLAHRTPSVSGSASNFLHAGAGANATVATSKPRLPPGDSSVGVTISVAGADFNSAAKVYASDVAFRGKTGGVGLFGGMGTDASGNLYYTVSGPAVNGSPVNELRRVIPPEGSETIWTDVPSGPTMGLLPVDHENNMYVPSGILRRLIKRVPLADPASASTYMDGFSSNIVALGIDSAKQLVVLTKTHLYRISRSTPPVRDTLQTFTNQGTPYALAVDGRDNIYVHFMSPPSTVTKDGGIIRYAPDGTTKVVVGVDAYPKFEFEGWNIAGGCADDLFMTPITWPAIGQFGEEFSLVQVNGTTNTMTQVFDGRRINNDLTDIDGIVYDRFGQTLLMWTDRNEGHIYRVPVRCGSIATDVHVVLPAGQPVVAPSLPAKTVITRTDGSREFVWNLEDVTLNGSVLGFDTVIAGLTLGQVRPVASEAFLTFRNPFAPGEIKQALVVPTVGVDGMVDLAAVVDRASYPANTAVMSTITLANRDAAAPRGGNLVVQMMDAQGALVSTLFQGPVAIGAGQAQQLSPAFNTSVYLVGAYRLVATLTDPATGTRISKADTGFDIVADGTRILTSVSADKAEYDPIETANIAARVSNVSLNAIVTGLTLGIEVRDPSGTVIFTQQSKVGATAGTQQESLLPGTLQDAFFRLPLVGRPHGTYAIRMTVNDATVPERTATFLVGSTAETGAGLTGTVTAIPSVVNGGEPVLIAAKVKNQGNAAVASAPISIRVIDPATGAVAMPAVTIPTTIAVGEEKTVTHSWDTTGAAGGVYVAVASVNIGARQTLLGQAMITVNAIDTTPDPFTFSPQTDIALGTTATSNEVTISGISQAVPIRIVGGQYSINDGPYTSADGMVGASMRVRVRLTAASTPNTPTTATLTVSAFSAGFTATTIALATTPDAFAFDPQPGVPLLTDVTSNSVTITGINTPVQISVSGGLYSVNEGPFVSTTGTVQNGDRVRVRVTSSASFGTATTATLTVSTVSAGFTATTVTVADVSLGLSFTSDTRLLVLISCKSSQGAADPVCVEQRRAFLATLLTSLGIEHRLTIDTEIFKLHLRGGHYNTYWITGGAEKLQGTLADEVREATFGGASLIADGIHDDRNHLIDPAFGVSYGGRVNGVTTVVTSGTILPQGTFNFLGEPIKTDLVGGTPQAGFGSATGSAAIVTHNYGAGRGVLFAFDLVATLMAQPSSTLLQGIATASIDFTVPPLPTSFTASSEVPLALALTNTEPVEVNVEVVAALAGFELVSSSLAPTSTAAGEIRWTVPLPANGSLTIDWTYMAPAAAGTYNGTLTVYHLYGGTRHEVAPRPIVVVIESAAIVLPRVIQELQAFALTVTAEQQARGRAITAIQQAQAAIGQAQHETALGALIGAIEDLDAIASVPTAPQQVSIDRVMQEVARRWYLALPLCPASTVCR